MADAVERLRADLAALDAGTTMSALASDELRFGSLRG
jgi:hypothetical protein